MHSMQVYDQDIEIRYSSQCQSDNAALAAAPVGSSIKMPGPATTGQNRTVTAALHKLAASAVALHTHFIAARLA
jgi:hypothetical protein